MCSMMRGRYRYIHGQERPEEGIQVLSLHSVAGHLARTCSTHLLPRVHTRILSFIHKYRSAYLHRHIQALIHLRIYLLIHLLTSTSTCIIVNV